MPAPRRTSPLALAAFALTACRAVPGELPICPAVVAGARALEADTRVLPPAAWFQVLIPAITRPALTLPEQPRECSGRPLTPDPRAPAPLPPRPLAESDLTFGEGPEGQLLVWARAVHFADGTALGPVALVRWVDRGLEIRGIGPLWAPTRRVRLRLEALGPDHLLVADGERCEFNHHSPAACTREIALLPLHGRRFLPADLVEGDTAGAARLAVTDRRDTPLADGWVRRAELRRHLRVDAASAVISESIVIRDCDPRAAPEVCQDQLHARDDRPLRLDGGRLVTTASAWTHLTGEPHVP